MKIDTISIHMNGVRWAVLLYAKNMFILSTLHLLTKLQCISNIASSSHQYSWSCGRLFHHFPHICHVDWCVHKSFKFAFKTKMLRYIYSRHKFHNIFMGRFYQLKESINDIEFIFWQTHANRSVTICILTLLMTEFDYHLHL